MSRGYCLLALLVAACAPARKPLGELVVHPLHELYPSLAVVHDAVFRVEKGRLVAAGANAGTDLDLVAMDDGCVRGDVGRANVHICPAPQLAGDGKELFRWRALGSDTLAYSTELLDYGDRLRIEANRIDAELQVPQGPLGDEIRSHPELIGAAFAFGLFPSSADSKDLWRYEVRQR